jgi:ABC-type sugar transport system ATPase subunit
MKRHSSDEPFSNLDADLRERFAAEAVLMRVGASQEKRLPI